MKRFVQSTLLLLMLAFSLRAHAQTTTTDYLNDIISVAQDIKVDARANRSALRTLAIDYFQNNNPNPNVAAYIGTMQTLQSNIESNSDDIIFFARQVSSLNPALNTSNIENWASQIEAREDYVQIESQNLANAIAVNNRSAARAANNAIRQNLADQISLSNLIINEAKALKLAPTSYNVRIELKDAYGNVYTLSQTGLQGFYAFDTANSTYIYPDYYNPEQFLNLAPGTYTFGAFDGYFDGAGSTTVTLSPSLIDANGFVVVQLSYWSE